jgi:hypothetical protein
MKDERKIIVSVHPSDFTPALSAGFIDNGRRDSRSAGVIPHPF